MEKLSTIIVTAAAILFFAPLIGVLGGAFVGWVVGLFFAETIHAFLAAVGINAAGLAMWQIGASLGFIGGFFRPAIHRAKA
ncbi:positive regulator of sigma E activity [Ochrobactrum intermedium]|uniref:Positive regulator of sigma E activity n=1 Tax=Brucella intermedia TaxID=94625 RepID=A0ABR6AP60_9HYPH|nr:MULTISPECIES: hypothetical protein [Brucella]MBA8851229.1 positive regulator of sigma E activity [Brucella intermedia]